MSADIPHSSFTNQDSLGAAITSTFGASAYSCSDMFNYCFYWVVPPLTDPVYLFPLSYRWTQLPEVTVDLQELYISSGLSEPTGDGRVLVFVFAFTIDNLSPTTKNTSQVRARLFTFVDVCDGVRRIVGEVSLVLTWRPISCQYPLSLSRMWRERPPSCPAAASTSTPPSPNTLRRFTSHTFHCRTSRPLTLLHAMRMKRLCLFVH